MTRDTPLNSGVVPPCRLKLRKGTYTIRRSLKGPSVESSQCYCDFHPMMAIPKRVMRNHIFLHTSFIKIEKFRYFSGGRQIYLTLLAWLLIQDKKSMRLNSIVSSPKQLLPAILFNKTRLHWCEFIGYILDSHSFSTKNKSKLHLVSI